MTMDKSKQIDASDIEALYGKPIYIQPLYITQFKIRMKEIEEQLRQDLSNTTCREQFMINKPQEHTPIFIPKQMNWFSWLTIFKSKTIIW